MATQDNKSGLLSKVARFVRNPTKDWSELDLPEPVQESSFNKLALKEMIERKRQNDFVRRREFDNLRKLRRNGPSINPELAGRPSFFQSSIPSNPDERATTLKKIDEIEAQMSKQWWKGRAEGGVSRSDSSLPGGVDSQGRDVPDPKTTLKEAASTFASTLAPALSPQTPSPTSAVAGNDRTNAPTDLMPLRASGNSVQDSGISGFSSSKLFSVELGDDLADPDLEEAAIRFANGDDQGAEAGLLAALQTGNPNRDAVDGWAAALFDLYRATGQVNSFESLAIDYAQRYGRSAPAWFSTPELLGQKDVAASRGPDVHQPVLGAAAWESPEYLDLADVQNLQAVLLHDAGPWCLQWGRLVSITPSAGQELAALFARWCTQAVVLQFRGAEVLEKTLRALTASGDKSVELFWWQLRLDALRILRLQDEFELAALDYCVVYEVSPPSWEDPICECVQESARQVARPSADEQDGGDPQQSLFAQTSTSSSQADAAVVVELIGEVMGDAAEVLNRLQAGLAGSDRLVISCAKVIRVDFAAAGSILNWVAAREAQGYRLQFRDVPRLVAAFFNVIGINEHAKVVLRTS